MKQQNHVNCPRCGSENEGLIHILKFPTQDTKNLRNDLINELCIWMLTKRIHPDILFSIMLGFKKWLTDRFYSWRFDSRIFTNGTIVNKVITLQIYIGWYNFLSGFISSDIVDLQRSSSYTFILGYLALDEWLTYPLNHVTRYINYGKIEMMPYITRNLYMYYRYRINLKLLL